MGTFYICPTPIGNLDDISKRILDTLNDVDLIYCEDTRRSKKLLDYFEIATPIHSYFLGNEHRKIKEIESHHILFEYCEYPVHVLLKRTVH